MMSRESTRLVHTPSGTRTPSGTSRAGVSRRTCGAGRYCATVKLPTNSYDDEATEHDALLGIFEELRSIRLAIWSLVVLVIVLIVVVYAGFSDATGL